MAGVRRVALGGLPYTSTLRNDSTIPAIGFNSNHGRSSGGTEASEYMTGVKKSSSCTAIGTKSLTSLANTLSALVNNTIDRTKTISRPRRGNHPDRRDGHSFSSRIEETDEHRARDDEIDEGRPQHADRQDRSWKREPCDQTSTLRDALDSERETAGEEAPRDESRQGEQGVGRTARRHLEHLAKEQRRNEEGPKRSGHCPKEPNKRLPVTQFILSTGQGDRKAPMTPQACQRRPHSMYPNPLSRSSISWASSAEYPSATSVGSDEPSATGKALERRARGSTSRIAMRSRKPRSRLLTKTASRRCPPTATRLMASVMSRPIRVPTPGAGTS